jgi:hypothetical protein
MLTVWRTTRDNHGHDSTLARACRAAQLPIGFLPERGELGRADRCGRKQVDSLGTRMRHWWISENRASLFDGLELISDTDSQQPRREGSTPEGHTPEYYALVGWTLESAVFGR